MVLVLVVADRLGLVVAFPLAPVLVLSLELGVAWVSTLHQRWLVALEVEATDCSVAYVQLWGHSVVPPLPRRLA